EEAEALARSLVEVANGAGTRTTALLTDMNQPLADAAGNALEVRHALDVLSGRKNGTRAHELVLVLAAEMLVQAGVAETPEAARQQAERSLDEGKAIGVFARMVHLLGGPADFVERPDHYLPQAAAVVPVVAQESGWLSACATRDIGLAVIELGGGRKRPQDDIDHAVGVSDILPLGSQVSEGDPIAFVHGADREQGERAADAVRRCFTLADEAPAAAPVVIKRIG
ncbi:MAG: thymidine phosphorylase, partial [Pseudorhizobium sp.]